MSVNLHVTKNYTAMKKFFLPIVLVAATFIVGTAQEQTATRTEYSVSLSEKVITLKPGETKQLTVSLAKSKSFARSKAQLGVSSSLPAGVTLAFEPAEGKFDSSVASFTAAADAKAGEYQVILKTTINNKIKGSILKVVVESSVAKDALSAN
jgi:uncharacterized membrane protein